MNGLFFSYNPIFDKLHLDRFFFYLQLFFNTVLGIVLGVIIGTIIVCRLTYTSNTSLPPKIKYVNPHDIIVVKKE